MRVFLIFEIQVNDDKQLFQLNYWSFLSVPTVEKFAYALSFYSLRVIIPAFK